MSVSVQLWIVLIHVWKQRGLEALESVVPMYRLGEIQIICDKSSI